MMNGIFDDWEEPKKVTCPECGQRSTQAALDKFDVCESCEAINEHLYFNPIPIEDDDADF
ncbi:hypothetical protein [Shewanella sp.]|uniref:hypothetical protein n=1 Tax=Shewanella sp. TaxID=50422 RepID=UPI0035632EB4